MIWQYDVPAIVMITNLVEMGREKCGKYWPNLGEYMEYDMFVVHFVSQDVGTHATTTILELRNDKVRP